MGAARNFVAGLGALVWLASGAARAQMRQGELTDVTLNGDAGTITGSLDVPGGVSGTFQFQIRKVEARNGELLMNGPLVATIGRSSQTVGGVVMRLSDGEGVCEMMALTPSPLHLRHLGIDVEGEAVDLSVSATSTGGRVVANLLCSVTHLLDEPGPLTASVATLNTLINRSLGTLAPAARPRLTNEAAARAAAPRPQPAYPAQAPMPAMEPQPVQQIRPSRQRALPTVPMVDQDDGVDP